MTIEVKVDDQPLMLKEKKVMEKVIKEISITLVDEVADQKQPEGSN